MGRKRAALPAVPLLPCSRRTGSGRPNAVPISVPALSPHPEQPRRSDPGAQPAPLPPSPPPFPLGPDPLPAPHPGRSPARIPWAPRCRGAGRAEPGPPHGPPLPTSHPTRVPPALRFPTALPSFHPTRVHSEAPHCNQTGRGAEGESAQDTIEKQSPPSLFFFPSPFLPVCRPEMERDGGDGLPSSSQPRTASSAIPAPWGSLGLGPRSARGQPGKSGHAACVASPPSLYPISH